MKKFSVLLIGLVLIFVLGGCSAILEKYNTPVDPESTEDVLFEVPAGASTGGIASALEEAGLIQNANSMKLKAKEMEVDGQMKAGQYKLSKAMDVESIITKLVDGDTYVETLKFTIPEGYEVRQIIDRLVGEGIVEEQAFIDVLEQTPFDYPFLEGIDRSYRLEGFLFPDTYEVAVGTDEKVIVKMMLDRFNDVFTQTYYDRAAELGMTVKEVVTLASIIEREAMLDDEFELVSSVFHNRIDQGMMLQSCATVQFILKERKERLSFDDIAIVSPFNTYTNAGLTPEPIASPGARALEAALYPADTDYLYFATTEKNDGSHYFNKTLAEHERDARKGQ
ncbi:endolytic transglycosylase MltG [Fusibacter sp. JL298sf-3]